MTVIDWTDAPSCSLLVEHTLIVFIKPQSQLSFLFSVNPGIVQGSGVGQLRPESAVCNVPNDGR